LKAIGEFAMGIEFLMDEKVRENCMALAEVERAARLDLVFERVDRLLKGALNG
jgi:hypothetical protein